MSERIIQLLLLAAAGAAGTLARFGLTSLTHLALAPLEVNPWRAAAGTLAVNVVGSFLFGLCFALTGPRAGAEVTPQALQMRLLILTGFMGAFTTFSTFSFDAVRLARESQWGGSFIYVVASIGIGVAGLLVGLWTGARVTGESPG